MLSFTTEPYFSQIQGWKDKSGDRIFKVDEFYLQKVFQWRNTGVPPEFNLGFVMQKVKGKSNNSTTGSDQQFFYIHFFHISLVIGKIINDRVV